MFSHEVFFLPELLNKPGVLQHDSVHTADLAENICVESVSPVLSRDEDFWEGTQGPGCIASVPLESLTEKGISRILKVFLKRLGTYKAHSGFVPFNWVKSVRHLFFQGSCSPTRPHYCIHSLEN